MAKFIVSRVTYEYCEVEADNLNDVEENILPNLTDEDFIIESVNEEVVTA